MESSASIDVLDLMKITRFLFLALHTEESVSTIFPSFFA